MVLQINTIFVNSNKFSKLNIHIKKSVKPNSFWGIKIMITCVYNSSGIKIQFRFIYTHFLYSFQECHDWSALPGIPTIQILKFRSDNSKTQIYISTIFCAMKSSDSVGKFWFLSLFIKHAAPQICCVFHGKYKTHSVWKALMHLRFIFFVLLEARCL